MTASAASQRSARPARGERMDNGIDGTINSPSIRTDGAEGCNWCTGRAPVRWMVGVRRFERPTHCSQSSCATRLRYTPTKGRIVAGASEPMVAHNHAILVGIEPVAGAHPLALHADRL